MKKLDIKNMTVLERLQAMEELWDSLNHENIEIASPEWHDTVLKNRIQRIENGQAEFISIKELKNSYSE